MESIAKDAEFEMSEKYLLYKTDTDEERSVVLRRERTDEHIRNHSKSARNGKEWNI